MNRFLGVLSFFIRSRIFKRDIPLIASFKLTYRCNLSCLACPFHLLSGQAGTHMGWDTACRSIDALSETGCPIVVFEGGEPLLWCDGAHTFSELAEYAKKRFVCTAATTNGTTPLNVPTDILWVSVDGLRETHNRLRSDSYDLVMENLGAAKHPRLYVHITLSRLNFTQCPDIIRSVSSIPSVKGITVQLFYPYGRGEEHLSLSDEEREQALKSVSALKEEGYPILNSAWGLNAMIDNSWTCRERLLANISPDGRVMLGCYVKNRGEVVCSRCGFTPVAEASGAYSLRPGPLGAGIRIFLMR
jgi:MoaA/NifB/PqqE/SkfB family radical SAM enzyme